MKQFINIPSKALLCNVGEITGTAYWPYESEGDPYWQNGSDPKHYRWTISMTVQPQYHSSPKTRFPNLFNGSDVYVGDFIADISTGVAVRVVRVFEKTDSTVTCEVEDVFRYNTFRDPSGGANGIFPVGADAIVFELNESGQPVVDTVAMTGPSFYNNLSSRFQNLEQNFNFVLEKEDHGFSVGDLIAADGQNNTFVLASPAFPFIIGSVTNTDLGPNAFAFNPFEKVVDNFNSLLGGVADIVYADDNNPGEYALAGNRPVMIGLRQETQSVSLGSVSTPSTTPGNEFSVNGSRVVVMTGDENGFIDAVNGFTAQTGVVASYYAPDTVVVPTSAPAGITQLPVSATINGVLVEFTTTTAGEILAGAPGYASVQDLAQDINAANIPGLVADIFTGDYDSLRLTSVGDVTIANGPADGMGRMFAGDNSVTGFAEFTAAFPADKIKLVAIDARPIEVADIVGNTMIDFGLVSVENGVKAAAIVIENGVRQAATYVVTNLSARDAINALFGDQCFVQDKGNGEWAHYIRTLDDQWVKIADKDSSETDAQTIELEITHESDLSGVIATISGGSRVSFVTVTVTEQFDGALPTLEVGDDNNNSRLMTMDQNDLKSSGVYSMTPSYTYSGAGDVDITFSFNSASSSVGKAVIAISYT